MPPITASLLVRGRVHAVFEARVPHGDRFARISPSVPGDGVPVVPHMVTVQRASGNLRAALGIPPEATVFCRYGGWDTFDIDYVHTTVRAASGLPATFFLFMNTDSSWCRSVTHASLPEAQLPRDPGCSSRVLFLNNTDDPVAKSRFIQTCDAMLHARQSGETFGLAIAEFAVHDRRVITEEPPEMEAGIRPIHVNELGERALYYHDQVSLMALLRGFDRSAPLSNRWGGYRGYSPRHVMSRFNEVFNVNRYPPQGCSAGDRSGCRRATLDYNPSHEHWLRRAGGRRECRHEPVVSVQGTATNCSAKLQKLGRASAPTALYLPIVNCSTRRPAWPTCAHWLAERCNLMCIIGEA